MSLESIEAKLDELLKIAKLGTTVAPEQVEQDFSVQPTRPGTTAPPPGFVWGIEYPNKVKLFAQGVWAPEQFSYYNREGHQIYRYGVQHFPVLPGDLEPLNDKPSWVGGDPF